MTLRQCIDYAMERNVQVRLQDIQQRTEEINLNTARNARLPQVSAGAGQNLDFGRGLTSNNTYADRNTQSTSFSVSASMPLFTGFRIPNQKKMAQLDLEAAKADLSRVKEDLSIQVAQAYLQALYNKEMIGVAEDQLALSNIQLERIKKVYNAKKASGLEVSQARNQVAQDELMLVQNENNYRLALLDLSQLIEMPSPDSLDVVSPTQTPEEVSGSPQGIYQEAVMQKPAIRAQQLRIESADKAIDIARAGYWPTLTLGAGLGTSYYNVSGMESSGFGRQLKDNFDKSISLQLSVPIFDHFDTRNNIRLAKLRRETQVAQLDQTQKDLYKEIQTAWYNAVAAQKKYESSVEAEAVAKESFEMMTKKFEYGKANITEYSEEKTKFANATSQRVSALYEYIFRMKILDFYRGTAIE